MNQKNKFGEYWKKFIEYLTIFAAACGSAVKAAWNFLRCGIRSLLQELAFLALAVSEKIQALIRKIKARFADNTSPQEENAADEEPAPEAENLEAENRDETSEQEAPEEDARDKVRQEDVSQDEAPQQEPSQNLTDGQAQPAEAAAQEAPEQEKAEQSEEEEQAEDKEQAEEEKKNEKPAVKFENPNLQKAYEIFWYICKGAKVAATWLWRLRKLIMAIPVLWTAIKLAVENMNRLPEKVGLDIQATGEFARMITRQQAVFWPLGITLFCLLLMFTSKKPILPWVISIFTLVLPWLIWILNYYA